MKTAAMGSLKLHEGENLEYAYASIRRASKMEPSIYVFDVVCTLDQIDEACNLLPMIVNNIKFMCPYLTNADITVGVTTNEQWRPGAMTLASQTRKEGKGVGFMDLNPSRG